MPIKKTKNKTAIKKKMIKKVVKKKTVKKAVKKVTKKILKRTVKKKEMVCATPEQCFWVWNGPILRNLQELQQALQKDISDIQFEYHCSKGKCDFALWVNDVLFDSVCARALAKAKNKKEAIKAIVACLKKYK